MQSRMAKRAVQQVLVCTFFACCPYLARALVDEAEDFQLLTSRANIVRADDSGELAEVDSAFGGDATRFTRLQVGLGVLQYSVEPGISTVAADVMVSTVSGQWRLTLCLGDTDIVTLSAQQLGQQITASSSASQQVSNSGEGYEYTLSSTTGGWWTGTVKLTTNHCEQDLKITINGGASASVQIGRVAIQKADAATCSSSDVADVGCPVTDGACPIDPGNTWRTFYDEAASLSHLHTAENVRVATGTPASFSGDGFRFARQNPLSSAVITYKSGAGGISRIRVAMALSLASEAEQKNVLVTVQPYVTENCKPKPHVTDLSRLLLSPMSGGWQFVEVEYTVGGLKALNCKLAKAVRLSFWAPAGSDVQVMYVKVIGEGAVSGLRELDNPGDIPPATTATGGTTSSSVTTSSSTAASSSSVAGCSTRPESLDSSPAANAACTEPASDSLRTFFDDASSPAVLHSTKNVQVATNEPQNFLNDRGRYSRRDVTSPASITYYAEEGGFHRIRAVIAIKLATEDALKDATVTVQPYVKASCKPQQQVTRLQQMVRSPLRGGWQAVEVEYTVGALRALDCALAKFATITFSAPQGSDIQMMSVKLIMDGQVRGMRELENPGADPGGHSVDGDSLEDPADTVARVGLASGVSSIHAGILSVFVTVVVHVCVVLVWA